MKFVLSTVLIIVIGMLGYGFYIKSTGDVNGEIIVGIGVLMIAFVLMPLFIIHRYKNKNMSEFRLDKWFDKLKENEKNNKK
jgi:ABC-type phosphate transport system permease subunit